MPPTTDLAPPVQTDRGVLQTADVIARMMRIQHVMQSVMKDGTHYGTIPGTPKPTLYKPGAELLLATFRIAAAPSTIDDLSSDDEIRYRVTVRATNQITGEFLGEMVGECSSDEEKYKWRKPVCDEEFAEADWQVRREVWKRGSSGAYKQKQIRTNPADVANTILKMATKRALIATTLVVLAASDIFSQDLEDLAEELRESVAGDVPKTATPKAADKQPQRKSTSGKAATTTKPEKLAATTPQTILGVIEKVERNEAKGFFAVRVKGDTRSFTQWVKDHEALEEDLKQVAGSGHPVTLSYVEATKGDKTYYNITGLAIADGTPTPAKSASRPPLVAGDIFGHDDREPGSDG